jgi:hypothetical protein
VRKEAPPPFSSLQPEAAIKPEDDWCQNEPDITGGKLPAQGAPERNRILIKMALNYRLAGEEERHKRPASKDQKELCFSSRAAALVVHRILSMRFFQSHQFPHLQLKHKKGQRHIKPSPYNIAGERTLSEPIVTSSLLSMVISIQNGIRITRANHVRF